MTKEPIEKNYQNLYKLNSHRVKKREYALYFDTKKESSFDSDKPTYIFDVDHTLLNINNLKEDFNRAFALYNDVFSPSVWKDTYGETKTKENYYDFTQHMQLLAEKLDNSKQSKEKLQTLMQTTTQTIMPDIIHPNLIWQINAEKDHINVILTTAGDTTYHRMKIMALIPYLPVLPEVIVFLEKTHKGVAINEIYKELNWPDSQEVYLFDDNPSELQEVHEACNGKKIHLIRVRQPNGHYNNKTLNKEIRAEEWNFNE